MTAEITTIGAVSASTHRGATARPFEKPPPSHHAKT